MINFLGMQTELKQASLVWSLKSGIEAQTPDGNATINAGEMMLLKEGTRLLRQDPAKPTDPILILPMDVSELKRIYCLVNFGKAVALSGCEISRKTPSIQLMELFSLLEKISSGSNDCCVLAEMFQDDLHNEVVLSGVEGLRRIVQLEEETITLYKTINYMHLNLRKKICIDQLVEMSGFKLTSLFSQFRKETGQTPLQYLKSIRLTKARAEMVLKGARVSEAAYLVGFQSISHFCGDYKKKFGVTATTENLGSLYSDLV